MTTDPTPSACPALVSVSRDALEIYIETRKNGGYERMKAAEEQLENDLEDALRAQAAALAGAGDEGEG